MPNSDPPVLGSAASTDSSESFAALLSDFERTHKNTEPGKQIEATVVSATADGLLFDIGFKSEGLLPLAALRPGESLNPGDKLTVSVKGRGLDGYYELTRFNIAQPRDWTALEQAFANKSTLVGTVTALIKGGVTVDIGVRAFMPASRTGTHDAAEMEKLVGTEIRCRITKLDVTDEDVVVDRRAVLEEEQRAAQQHRYAEMKEGDTVHGTVRSLADYGAFIDIGGIDALLHVSDLSWSRVSKPSDVLAVGQQIEARVLKIDPEKRRISLGLKQLQAQPWDSAPDKYKVGERVRGAVTRTTDFGAFVELEPGVEGLIHISEFSWGKKVRKPSDLLKPGETVEAVILAVNAAERRISLGLKQALGDPWTSPETAQRFAPGAVIEGPVTSITNFGAFLELAPGIEGMVHVSEISADKHIAHPRDALRLGQLVKAQVLAIDPEKRQVRLSIKQMVPTSLDEYLADHHPGDLVTGRIIEATPDHARVELGEGILATCRLSPATPAAENVVTPQTGPKNPAPELASQKSGTEKSGAANAEPQKADLSSLTAMLQSRWKGNAPSPQSTAPHPGEIRTFRINTLNSAEKKIDLELAP